MTSTPPSPLRRLGRRLRPVRKRVEVALTRLALAVVPRLPRRVVVGLADLMGTVGAAFAPHHRKVGMANLRLAFPDWTDRRRRKVLRGSFRTAARMVVDLFWFGRDTEARIRTWVHLDPEAYAPLFGPGPTVALTPHLGNWELLGQAVALNGAELVSVAAQLKNPAVEAHFLALRQRTGQRIVPQEGAVRALIRTLRAGGRVALLVDQNTKPRRGGVFVDYFGHPVPVSPAPAWLARKTGAGVFFGHLVPRPDGGYHGGSAGYLTSEEVAAFPDDAALVRRMVEATEQAVREHPEAWLWTYKRWKIVPPDARAEAFPFYARPLSDRD